MPIYEYECQSCGHRLEVIQKMADQPLQDCPACEEAALKKLVSAAAFKLKGGGWYETDFKNKAPVGASKGEGGDNSGGKADGNSDKSGDKKADSGAASTDSGASKSDNKALSSNSAGSTGSATKNP